VPLAVAAFCPHPPLLVPELAAGAAHELDELRRACDAAIATLLAARPGLLVLLGAGPTTREYQCPFRASFSTFGVPVEIPIGAGPPSGPALPLSLAIGVWLLHRAGGVGGTLIGGTLRAEAVAADAPVEECVELGARYARHPAPIGVLVMGDGSACRSDPAPGGLDPRAGEFDAAVAKALAEVDTRALLALDRGLAAELVMAGRAPWQVLAAAAGGVAVTGGAGTSDGVAAAGGVAAGGAGVVGTRLAGEVLYDAAPYGVNYTVAVWA
jgi:hypothetical protein